MYLNLRSVFYNRVKITALYFIPILFFINDYSYAQNLKIRPAVDSDLIGYWRIHLVPNNKHNSQLKNELTGYADPCQFFVHRSDGKWFNVSINNSTGVEQTKKNCLLTKKDMIEASLIASTRNETPYQWSKMPDKDGYFYVRNMLNTAQFILWKADFVTVDIPESVERGYDLRKGDIVMQLTRQTSPSTLTPIWPMVLKPVID